PFLMWSLTHTGCTPRPAHVFPEGLCMYFGGTFTPFLGDARRTAARFFLGAFTVSPRNFESSSSSSLIRCSLEASMADEKSSRTACWASNERLSNQTFTPRRSRPRPFLLIRLIPVYASCVAARYKPTY